MRRDEVTAFGELTGDAAGGLADQIHELHNGIARRVWRAVGPAATPVRLAHDQISRGAYAVARGVTRSMVSGGVRRLAAAGRADGQSIERTVLGRAAVGALNGIWGDTLKRRDNGL